MKIAIVEILGLVLTKRGLVLRTFVPQFEGNATVHETVDAGIGELITITANKYLAGPFLIKLTGPLLRLSVTAILLL